MDTRTITGWIVFFTIVVLVIFDAFMVANGKPGDTISEVITEAAHRWPVIAFAFGLLCGHLFWGK
jgi:hypothetical protein